MKKITIKLEDQVARWARVWAAEHDTSVSRLLGEMLKDRMRQETGYEAAMRRFRQRAPRQLRKAPEPYPSRDELRNRNGLR